MPSLPEPPRDPSGLPVEGFLRGMVWGVLFILGAGLLLAAALREGRGAWVLMSGLLLLIGIVRIVFAFRRRRRVRETFRLGREVPSELVRVTTVTRNGLVSCWVAVFRLKEKPPREVELTLELNPAGAPFTLLVHEGRVGAYGRYEGKVHFRVKRLFG